MDSMIRLQKILCSVDFSESSLEALKHATHLALNDSAILYLILTVDSNTYDYGEILYKSEMSDAESMTEQSLINLLKGKLLEEVPKVIQDKVEMLISYGVPFVEIIKAAKDNDIDLIVMGTHGRSGILRLLIGSVAEKVIRNAPCPVLTVKTEENFFDQ
ncbi:MAG: universal stress protein [Candidatus Scalinduaceae bacterium]